VAEDRRVGRLGLEERDRHAGRALEPGARDRDARPVGREGDAERSDREGTRPCDERVALRRQHGELRVVAAPHREEPTSDAREEGATGVDEAERGVEADGMSATFPSASRRAKWTVGLAPLGSRVPKITHSRRVGSHARSAWSPFHPRSVATGRSAPRGDPSKPSRAKYGSREAATTLSVGTEPQSVVATLRAIREPASLESDSVRIAG
jgi:hypothetical protein